MSLLVSKELQLKAVEGNVSKVEFVECMKESLPHAWQILSKAATLLKEKGEGPAIVEPADVTDEMRGQLLRALASNAIKGAVEEHFGVKFAFQNCHKTAAFLPEEVGGAIYEEFTSIRSQLLNQKPELLHC